jgi:mRNA interferase MazF
MVEIYRAWRLMMRDENQLFDNWNEIKKDIQKSSGIFFHQREIFYAKIGQNIGFEQSGKGESFIRPLLIYKKFNSNLFLGIPLSTTKNRGKYYFEFSFKQNKTSVAILSQIRLFDSKRLIRKIGKIDNDNFNKLKERLFEIL